MCTGQIENFTFIIIFYSLQQRLFVSLYSIVQLLLEIVMMMKDFLWSELCRILT